MPRKRWTTKEQYDWLFSRLPEFRTKCTEGKSTPWLTALYQEFFDTFPNAQPSQKELDKWGGDVQKAKNRLKEKRKKQLYWWFWNRRIFDSTGSRKTGKKTKKNDLKLLVKKSRALQPYQAYLRLYSDKIMPGIRERHKAHKLEQLPEGENHKEWFSFMIAESKRLLAEESDEVKREVEEYRKMGTEEDETAEELLARLHASDDLAAIGGDGAKAIQKRIEQLPSTVRSILKQVKSLTGWNGSMFLGGPNPTTGKMTTLIVHNGETLNLHHTFPNATTLWQDIEQAWDRFITASFAADAAEKLHQAYSDDRDGSAPPGSSSGGNSSSAASTPRSSASPPPEPSSPSAATDNNAQPSSSSTRPKPRPRPRQAEANQEGSSGTQEEGNGTGAPAAGHAPTSGGTLPAGGAAPGTSGSANGAPPIDGLAYERERLQTIEKNQQMLLALGLVNKGPEPPATCEEPDWMSSALEYLEDIEVGESWDVLLEAWAAFECVMGYPDGKKRLSAKGRPEEVARWIAGGRQYDKVPVPDSLERYSTAWCAWWKRLQPAARRDVDESEWPLPQVLPENPMEWDALRRGGCNGIFIAVMGLAIWASALDEETQPEDFLDAVGDVYWVLSTVIDTLPTGTKRTSDGVVSGDDQPRKKRRTHS